MNRMEVESLIALAIVVGFLLLVVAQHYNVLQRLKDTYDAIVRYVERIDPHLVTTIVLILVAVVLAAIAGFSA